MLEVRMAGRWIALLMTAVLVSACGAAGTSEAPAQSNEADPSTAQSAEPAGFTPTDAEVFIHSGEGGSLDTIARLFVQTVFENGWSETLWPMNNRTGGSGAVAMAYMAENEGNPNIIAHHSGTWISSPILIGPEAPTVRDFTPIAGIGFDETLIYVPADSEIMDLEDLFAEAQERPILQAMGSVGSLSHVNALLLQEAAGVEWDFLSFESVGERQAALLGGNADVMFEDPISASLVESGDLRVIASTDAQRSKVFPDVPTAAEQGYEGLISNARGFIAAGGIPEEARSYWQELVRDFVESEQFEAYVEESGLNVTFLDSEEWAADLERIQETYQRIFDDLGLSGTGT